MGNRNSPEEKPVIVVSSVTYALKGRDLLFRKGIKAYVERLPRTRESGCGYGIYVPVRTGEAEQILREAGVKVFHRTERGASS
ncbi:MAG: DUF3343 domain-containing protein [Hominenteromicrobium sp.]